MSQVAAHHHHHSKRCVAGPSTVVPRVCSGERASSGPVVDQAAKSNPGGRWCGQGRQRDMASRTARSREIPFSPALVGGNRRRHRVAVLASTVVSRPDGWHQSHLDMKD